MLVLTLRTLMNVIQHKLLRMTKSPHLKALLETTNKEKVVLLVSF